MRNFVAWLKKAGPVLLLSSGLLLLGVSGLHFTLRDRSLRLRADQVPSYQVVVPEFGPNETTLPERPPAPDHIFVPWRLDVDITPGVLQGDTWSVDEKTATFLSQTARPGEGGNIVIYGHNTRKILGNIRVFIPGEEITLTTQDGQEHTYKVTWTKEVSPDDVSAIQPTDAEVLTLFTCSGFLDSQRFIVRAEPVGEVQSSESK